MPHDPSLAARIEQFSMPLTESGCWIWLRRIDGCGYGRLQVGVHSRSASRMSWTAYRGPIPDGLHVLHHCDIRCCVNPDHLFLGTNSDNVNDKVRKGRAGAFSFQSTYHASGSFNQKRGGGRGRRNSNSVGAVRKPHGRWEALITINRKQKYLGTFLTKEEASAAYRTAVAKLEQHQ